MGAVHPASILPLPPMSDMQLFIQATTLLSLFKIPKVHRTLINLSPRVNLTNIRCAVLMYLVSVYSFLPHRKFLYLGL